MYRPVGDGIYRISTAGLNSISDADEEVIANCVKGKPWGSGPHDFMRRLFNLAIQRKVNFYNDLLEPLFYDALNRNRGEQGYCPALHCRIPFLSGGLFEPIDGYDWEHNDFSIPNEVFSNVAEKGRDADGILDIFDRYNFTMSEDEPMEREVAIDPEMLGKVFENLLEINDRKSKGAFYTPREIVHYMCQESLINYLTKSLNISEGAIRNFILYGDFMKDQDTEKTLRVADNTGIYHLEFDFEKEMYVSEEILSFKKGVNRLLDIDTALKNVRVADPAVGSGAFPLGMLNEIVRARQNISAYLAITMKPYDVLMMYQMDRSPHTLKYETIRNCIFACDIEPSAVDITQLRLWLALVIDDEINPNAQTPLDGHRNPLPLPNLESNILCGNSLIDEFEGIPLVKESELLGSTGNYQLDITSDRFDSIIRKLIETQDELFRCDDTEKKKQLKEQIDSLRDMIILTQLEGCDSAKIQRYYETKHLASKPYVLWQLDFARVFREKGGFDIVIGNPPYIGESGHKDIFRAVAETEFGKRSYQGKMDFFYFFFHKGLDILHSKGDLAFITTNYFPTATGAKTLRKDFASRTYMRQLINFNEVRVFESALGQHNMITILTKDKEKDFPCRCTMCSESVTANAAKLNSILMGKDEKATHVFVAQDNLYDGSAYYIRQQGVKSQATDSVGSILDKMVAQKLRLGMLAEVNQGVVSGCDYVSNRNIEYITDPSVALKDGIFVLDLDYERDRYVYDSMSEEEKKLFRPFFKNSEIHRYHCNLSHTKVLLYLSKNVKSLDNYPQIENHLRKFWNVLMRRREAASGKIQAYHLQWARTEDIFIGEKIVVPYRTKETAFAYNDIEWFCRSDAYVITPKSSTTNLFFLLGVLNSKLNFLWLYNRGKRKGEVLELFQVPLSEIPVIETTAENKERISHLAREITEAKKAKKNSDTSAMEKEIDQILYKAYGLSEAEIAIVEDSIE